MSDIKTSHKNNIIISDTDKESSHAAPQILASPRRLHCGMHRPRQIRKKVDTEALGDAAEGAEPTPPPPPPPVPAKPKSKKAASMPGLSFDLEAEGEEFQVKKKKKRPKASGMVAEGGGEASSAAPVDTLRNGSAGVYTAEMLAKLRGSQQFKKVEAADAPIPGDVLPGEQDASAAAFPDSDAVRIARAQRERARRGADEGAEADGEAAAGQRGPMFIPLDGRDAEDSGGATSRLVHEDDVKWHFCKREGAPIKWPTACAPGVEKRQGFLVQHVC